MLKFNSVKIKYLDHRSASTSPGSMHIHFRLTGTPSDRWLDALRLVQWERKGRLQATFAVREDLGEHYFDRESDSWDYKRRRRPVLVATLPEAADPRTAIHEAQDIVEATNLRVGQEKEAKRRAKSEEKIAKEQQRQARDGNNTALQQTLAAAARDTGVDSGPNRPGCASLWIAVLGGAVIAAWH
jgi:hypothetical protein